MRAPDTLRRPLCQASQGLGTHELGTRFDLFKGGGIFFIMYNQ
jgi:hypothetical protein